MKFTPRDYQQNAHDAVISWWKHTTDSCVIEAATGAGKSLIIAMLAKTLFDLSGGKRVLCLAPNVDLIEQNSAKYKALGEECSIYSASIGKSLRHQVIFATELSFKKVAKRLGHEFAGVIIDECHRTTPTIKNIISDMKQGNPNLRVCGLSATPYRLDSGFIFEIDTNGDAIHESQAREPYFKRLVYYIGAEELIQRGFLTPPKIGDINADTYDTSALEIQRNGSFSAASIDKAFAGWGRKTADIIADVIAQSVGKRGVMLFASTVRHAEEIMASLPPSISRMIGGGINTKKAERKKLVSDFKAQKYKYLVSVETMTTGVDFTHVDVVAILRATESVSLLQQIIGRGLRLHDGKYECLVLDYAENLERHCPEGDLFRPEIRAPYQGGETEALECYCPDCNRINTFSARKNDDGFEVDSQGYFVDLDGNRVEAEVSTGVTKPIPAHHGRRCQQQDYNSETKSYERCGYFWSFKECLECDHYNDIAARYCQACKAELIDPAAKLTAMHTKSKKNPREVQCDEVLGMVCSPSISRTGNPILRVEFTTPYRLFTVFYQTEAKTQWLSDKYQFFMSNTNNGTTPPRTVTYLKNKDFWEVKGFNRPTDDEVLKDALSRVS